MHPLLCFMFPWPTTNCLHKDIGQSVHKLHSRLKLFFDKWSYSMHSLLYVFSWHLLYCCLHNNIRQSVHKLHSRL